MFFFGHLLVSYIHVFHRFLFNEQSFHQFYVLLSFKICMITSLFSHLPTTTPSRKHRNSLWQWKDVIRLSAVHTFSSLFGRIIVKTILLFLRDFFYYFIILEFKVDTRYVIWFLTAHGIVIVQQIIVKCWQLTFNLNQYHPGTQRLTHDDDQVALRYTIEQHVYRTFSNPQLYRSSFITRARTHDRNQLLLISIRES